MLGTRALSTPRFYTCAYVLLTPTVTFPKGKYTVKDKFTCTRRNVIYDIFCRRCNKKYIGAAGLRLADRLRHISTISATTLRDRCPYIYAAHIAVGFSWHSVHCYPGVAQCYLYTYWFTIRKYGTRTAAIKLLRRKNTINESFYNANELGQTAC